MPFFGLPVLWLAERPAWHASAACVTTAWRWTPRDEEQHPPVQHFVSLLVLKINERAAGQL